MDTTTYGYGHTKEAAALVREALKGTIFYASARAMRERLYKEGQHVTITAYRNYRHYTDNFIEVNLSSDPTCYIHLTLDEEKK